MQLYRDDVSKFAAGYEEKVYAVFDGIPGQLPQGRDSEGRNMAFATVYGNVFVNSYALEAPDTFALFAVDTINHNPP